MPGGDKSGPMGQGPMTGRNLGFCGGYDTPGFAKGYGQVGRGSGMGRGRRAGRGRGVPPGRGLGLGRFNGGNWLPETMNRENEAQMLKARAENLKGLLKEIDDRLNQIGEENA